jgi:DNA polymerase-3 subunit epsilon
VLATGDPLRERELSGYVLTVENITRSLEQESRRDQVLQSLTDGSRGSLANIRVAVGNLMDYPDMEADIRERFVSIISDEVVRMSQRLDQTMSEFADSLKTRWPLEDVQGMDIIAAAQRRIEDRAETHHQDRSDRRGRLAESREFLTGVLDMFPGIPSGRALSS